MAIGRLVLAVLLGLVLGSVVNMALIVLGGQVIPGPAGADMRTAEDIAAALPQLAPRHFLFPFLAHALGTFAGAWIAARLAARYRLPAAMTIGLLFLAGGVAAALMSPAPAWFITLDLACAYLPAAVLAWLLARPRVAAGQPTG